jgi:molybdopterin-containing oxidoreductase family iron-sulfur binding subunit
MGDATSFSRRRFMQLMGASLALSSGAACRWDKDNLLAFTRRPAGHTPGVPKHFATAMELGGYATGLSVVSYDGRPIKIEGNSKHPISRGGSSAFAQASILEIYDPDRSQTLVQTGHDFSPGWADFAEWLQPVMAAARSTGGADLRILAEASHSPTRRRLQSRLQAAYPALKWVEYEPLSRDNERLGTAMVFGRAVRPHYDLTRADVVVALDEDLFVEHPAALAYARDFATSRQPQGGKMSRLYAIESRFSVTGGMADHRLAIRSEQVEPFVWALTGAIVRTLGTIQPDLAAYARFATPAFLSSGPQARLLAALAKDLAHAQGRSVLAVGPGQPPQVHALVHQLNALLGNIGTTVALCTEPMGERPAGVDALAALADEMRAGHVKTLVMLGGNPTFTAPPQLRFGEALAAVPNSVHLSGFHDETSHAASWHLPRTHYLESWDDARAFDGTQSIVQPLIDPLYKTRSSIEVLSLMLGEERNGQTLVRETFDKDEGTAAVADKEAHWRQALHDGVVPHSTAPAATLARRPLNVKAPTGAVLEVKPDNGALELTFWTDSHVYDGRFANNGWLQELPDFMTKLTWDNAATVAPATAEALGLKHEHMATLKVDGQTLTLPVYVMPGQAPGSVAVTLGYGRTHSGHVAGLQKGEVESAGFNTYMLRGKGAHNYASGLQIDSEGTFFELAITQDHHAMDETGKKGTQARIGEIVREATLAHYKDDPEFAQHTVEHPPLESLWEEPTYTDNHRWGMAIDLNNCIGCNACVVACQAENNIPIVGKKNVIMGREMHWIRIDRYFSGDVDTPRVVHQPMTCQQCEMAPCEEVCPVAATVHSREGLNDMVYNRCIGTRYCSNNCPYKVRRFNFFNYHKSLEKSENQVAKMQYNPEVTVRARGVMEKCTYCVQRIANVKIPARNAKRPIADGEIVTACAQACPAGAITFGDLNDKNSAVLKKHKSSRAYYVLEELNTKPRTAYLARVRNPNPELV